MKITLCLLTWDELEGCKHDIPLIDRTKFDEIYAIDAGSNDGTVEYLKKANIPAYKQPKKGLNAACKYAVEKCTTDAVIFFHPKGTTPVSDTLKFRKYFETGYELIIGSRIIKGGVNEEDSKWFRPRKLAVKTFAIIAFLLWRKEGRIIWDVLHGFRGITIKAFNQINPPDYGLAIDLEMISRSYKKRIKAIEFPTKESPRIHGKTHFTAFPTGKKLVISLVNELIRPAGL